MPSEQHVYTHPSRVEHWRHVVEIGALSIAALWAFYVFVYQERIKPAYLAPSLELTARVSHTSMHSGKELITIETPLKNIGSVDLQVDGLIVNVYGLRYGDRITEWSERAGPNSSELRALPVMPATMLITSLKLYQPLGGSGSSFFRPEREKIPSISIALPAGAYDAVRVQYSVCYQRADDRSKYPVHITRTNDGTYDVNALANLEGDTGPSCPTGVTIAAI